MYDDNDDRPFERRDDIYRLIPLGIRFCCSTWRLRSLLLSCARSLARQDA